MKAIPAFALAILVLAMGCKGKPNLVGHWTGKLDVSGTPVEMDLTFDKAGTLAFKQTMMGQTSTQKGNYKETEKTVAFTPSSVESPSLTKEQLSQINAQVAAAKKTVTFDLVWKDADHISVSQQGAPAPLNKAIELTRQPG